MGLRERVLRSLCRAGFGFWDSFGLSSNLCNRHLSKVKTFTVEYYGTKYQGKTDNKADALLYLYGASDAGRRTFVREMAQFIKYRTGKPFCLYDIGAGHGDCCLALVGLADCVVAFEKSPERFAYLEDNVAASGAKNVRILNIEVSDADQASGSHEFGTAAEIVGAAVFSSTNSPARSSSRTLEKADLVVESENLQLPDFIRINAGADYRSVLRGLTATLERSQPVVFIEQPTSLRSPYANETDLRSALYEDAKLYTFSGSPYRTAFTLDTFDARASRIVCYPAKITRMIEHEVCKMGSLRMLGSRR